ncbi:hypothetical protein LguiA_026326 [Lonicera macranthoides]
MDMKIRKSRVWWPTHLLSNKPQSFAFLYGWIVTSSSASIDIVVAFASVEDSHSSTPSDLQEILHETNGKMPVFLQDKCMLSMLGYCAADSSCNGQLDNQNDSTHGNFYGDLMDKYEKLSCGCQRTRERASIENNTWVKLVYNHEYIVGQVGWIPKLHHIHCDGQTLSNLDLHVIVYETPRFGGHHFSLGFQSSSELVKTPLKKPKWVEELHLKQSLLDLDTIILAINCATAAKSSFEGLVVPKRYTIRFVTFTWQLLAMSAASFSTLYYIILQFFHVLLSYGSQSYIYIVSERLFSNTWKNIQIRSCQILYWSIFLRNTGVRSESCVEYAEKAALQKHSVWSSVAVDVLLGNLVGTALLFHTESVYLWLSNFANDITNHLLRIGCVWLMGIPAGFKLNTELAGVLGLISLNVIQIWSTLWFFVGSSFIYFIKGLAMSGVIFGLTTLAALVVDMISLATIHVSTLHWLISLLYSQQIQAIAALWRLFRGQKWNPLRQRLDSYNYTVEQHIIGSLLFTPLLLLLPTTSAFYIFFTIMNRSISFICIFIEVTISIIHATPYTKIFLWLVRSRRFPCGVWFEIISCRTDYCDNDKIGSSLESMTDNTSGSRFSVLLSFLHSNSLNIRQIVWPHYRYIYSVVTRSYVALSAYGVLTGRRSAQNSSDADSFNDQNHLGTKSPWMMLIPYKEYWRLCYDAVLASKADCKCHLV